ncbi:hypothetical protein [Janibacter indicus]|uniref:hypothetical protein n=1 Tax=Janibacter indicus TaxID=857417 RepID=UPI003EC05A9C
MTSMGQTDGSTREDYWRTVGQVGAQRQPLGDTDESAQWPAGSSAYRHVTTPHSGIIATDGLSDAAGDSLGLEVYVEGRELVQDPDGEGRWLVSALEEAAGALAAAGAEQVDAALRDHTLLSLEISAGDAPADWVSEGRLGVLVGVELPGRPQSIGSDVRVLALTPLRPSELAVVTGEGPAGRRRVAEAMAGQGWYSYADSTRPPVA